MQFRRGPSIIHSDLINIVTIIIFLQSLDRDIIEILLEKHLSTMYIYTFIVMQVHFMSHSIFRSMTLVIYDILSD